MATVTTASIITLIRGLIKDTAQTTGRDVYEYDTSASFTLSKDYVSSSGMKVYKNGTELTTGWTYNSTTNKVTISAALVKGDNIIVTYTYFAKYSDTEIQNYIKSNLVRFTEKQYSKYFYMNDNNEVVTLNGNNPSYEEGDVIARITAIDIDPQNVKIRTPEFTMEPAEKKSKSEQINDVLNSFLRNFGTVDFLEDDANG